MRPPNIDDLLQYATGLLPNHSVLKLGLTTRLEQRRQEDLTDTLRAKVCYPSRRLGAQVREDEISRGVERRPKLDLKQSRKREIDVRERCEQKL
jgi:hypothetical protein